MGSGKSMRDGVQRLLVECVEMTGNLLDDGVPLICAGGRQRSLSD